MFGCPDVKTAFVFAAINNNAAIKLKTINNARAKLFGKYIFKTKLVDNFRWRFENDFQFAIW